MSNIFDGDPKTGSGAVGWVVLGSVAAVLALLVGTMFPSIIPARATQSRL
jgi:hypothetical protein